MCVLYVPSGGNSNRKTRIMCVHIYYTLVSVSNNYRERHVLDAVCWSALISRAPLRPSSVISARHSSCRQVFLLLIYLHYLLWHIDSSVGLLSPIRWQPVFNSRRGWRSWLDIIAILRTAHARFSPSLHYCFVLSYGLFAWTIWTTIFVCFFIFIYLK
jgi:hypothetical protein